jgi:RHS repeat-associated protein
VYDAASRPTATVDSLGNRTTTTFDAASRPVATIDPLGRRSTTLYDAASRVRATIDAAGNRTTLGYDAASQSTSVLDALSRRSTTVYDAAGRTKATVDALSFRTTLGYDAASRPTTVEDPLGFVLTSVYDAANRLRATVDQLSNRTTFSYDAASRRISVQNPLGNIVTTLYNSASWVRANVNPLGYRTSLSYNNAGWQTAVVDASSNRTTTVFDATGRAVATVNALTNRVTQVFDAAGRRTALVDANANRYTFAFDAANRLTRQVDPLSRATTFGYNVASEQTLRIDARRNRTTYVADSLSRPIKRLYPDGSRVTMAYDAVSNRTLLADSTGRYTTLYDALNRARAVTNPANLTISYSFDAASRRRTMLEPFGGVFTYGYSATNLNTLVVNPQGERTTWQYDAGSRVTVQRLANLVRVSYAYDNSDRLLRLANLTSTGTTLTSYADTWDPANNRLHRVEQDGTRVTWSYDSTYQLTNEQRNGANSYNTTYGYDPAGNRRFKLDNSIRTTYSYDAANQLQKYLDNTGTTTFSFDTSGNQRRQIASSGAGTTTNTWDFENRLTKVALPSGVLNTFTYNADGLRVQRQDSSGTLNEICDGQKVVEETDQNNVSQVVYTQSDGEFGDVVSERRSGTSRYFAFDPLGSTMRLTDGSQNVTDTYLFKAFGESLLASGPTTNPFQYVGQQGYYLDKDPSSLHLCRRDYLARIALFLSTDPITPGSSGSSYAYTVNNPVNAFDPSGLLSVEVVSKKSIACGGAELHFIFKPGRVLYTMPYDGVAILVLRICIYLVVTRCDPPMDNNGCCCGPLVFQPFSNPCCFYESLLIYTRSWKSGRFQATDDIDVPPINAPGGCPNTLGIYRFRYDVRLFKFASSAEFVGQFRLRQGAERVI